MRITIDRAGRVVIPKALRDRVGLQPGDVEVTADGTGIHIEAIAEGALEDRDGRLVVPASGVVISDDTVSALRDADQR